MTAAFLHLISHALMKIVLFYCIGAIMVRTGRKYLWEMDGIAHKMPLLMTIYTIAGIALIGIPPFCGFISKWYIATAAVKAGTVYAYIGLGALITSAFLTAAYVMELVIRAWTPVGGEKDGGILRRPDAGMCVPLVILTVAIIVYGLFSGPLLHFFERIAGGLI